MATAAVSRINLLVAIIYNPNQAFIFIWNDIQKMVSKSWQMFLSLSKLINCHGILLTAAHVGWEHLCSTNQ
jgi:hypothetical protein